MSATKSNTTNGEQISEQLVDEASRFLVKVLRHTPTDYEIHLNGRGWASEKDVRRALADQFDEVIEKKQARSDKFVGSVDLIRAVLDADMRNRFQRMSVDRAAYGMIRATRKHSVDLESLIPVEVHENALNTYRVEYPNGNPTAFVVAENETIADRLYQAELLDTISKRPTDEVVEKYAEHPITDPKSLLHDGVNFLLSQDPSQPRKIKRRVNMGDQSEFYATSHPYRFRERLPDTPSAELE